MWISIRKTITGERGPENLFCNAFLPYSRFHLYLPLLVLAGIELILFTVANMGLWFGFVLETVLIIQGCFRYC